MIYALQFVSKQTWYLSALGIWAAGLLIRHAVEQSMMRHALEAIASTIYCQYQMFISPDTGSGISISLQMVIAAVVGGVYMILGPTVGAATTILLTESLRISFGTAAVGWDNLV